jgi:3'-5' exoribonuclease
MLDQKDLNEHSIGDDFTLFLIVNKCEIKTSKNGKSFLNLELRDRTVTLPAKIWDNVESSFLKLKDGAIVKVAGTIEEFNNAPQIRIEKWRVATSEDDISPEDFLPKSRRALPSMIEEFEQVINSVNNHFLHRLLKNIFSEDSLRKYTRTPAGKGWHHAYIHGLLEHTLEIVRICDLMCSIHPEINRDLLVSGALLHDFGKTEELTYDTAFDYTDKGKLIGHIMIGAIAVEKSASAIENFPIELKERLIHLVLSHQGKLEYASPVEPKTLEAIVLYQADELSAKTNAYKSAIEAEKNKGSKWTKFLPLANTSLMITDEFTKE